MKINSSSFFHLKATWQDTEKKHRALRKTIMTLQSKNKAFLFNEIVYRESEQTLQALRPLLKKHSACSMALLTQLLHDRWQRIQQTDLSYTAVQDDELGYMNKLCIEIASALYEQNPNKWMLQYLMDSMTRVKDQTNLLTVIESKGSIDRYPCHAFILTGGKDHAIIPIEILLNLDPRGDTENQVLIDYFDKDSRLLDANERQRLKQHSEITNALFSELENIRFIKEKGNSLGSHLERLNQTLKKGGVSGTGSELDAGTEALLGIIAFRTYWDGLSIEQREKAHAMIKDSDGQSLLDHLFRQKELNQFTDTKTDHQPSFLEGQNEVIYCINNISSRLSDILKDHPELFEGTTLEKTTQLEASYEKCVNLQKILEDQLKKRQYTGRDHYSRLPECLLQEVVQNALQGISCSTKDDFLSIIKDIYSQLDLDQTQQAIVVHLLLEKIHFEQADDILYLFTDAAGLSFEQKETLYEAIKRRQQWLAMIHTLNDFLQLYPNLPLNKRSDAFMLFKEMIRRDLRYLPSQPQDLFSAFVSIAYWTPLDQIDALLRLTDPPPIVETSHLKQMYRLDVSKRNKVFMAFQNDIVALVKQGHEDNLLQTLHLIPADQAIDFCQQFHDLLIALFKQGDMNKITFMLAAIPEHVLITFCHLFNQPLIDTLKQHRVQGILSILAVLPLSQRMTCCELFRDTIATQLEQQGTLHDIAAILAILPDSKQIMFWKTFQRSLASLIEQGHAQEMVGILTTIPDQQRITFCQTFQNPLTILLWKGNAYDMGVVLRTIPSHAFNIFCRLFGEPLTTLLEKGVAKEIASLLRTIPDHSFMVYCQTFHSLLATVLAQYDAYEMEWVLNAVPPHQYLLFCQALHEPLIAALKESNVYEMALILQTIPDHVFMDGCQFFQALLHRSLEQHCANQVTFDIIRFLAVIPDTSFTAFCQMFEDSLTTLLQQYKIEEVISILQTLPAHQRMIWCQSVRKSLLALLKQSDPLLVSAMLHLIPTEQQSAFRHPFIFPFAIDHGLHRTEATLKRAPPHRSVQQTLFHLPMPAESTPECKPHLSEPSFSSTSKADDHDTASDTVSMSTS